MEYEWFPCSNASSYDAEGSDSSGGVAIGISDKGQSDKQEGFFLPASTYMPPLQAPKIISKL